MQHDSCVRYEQDDVVEHHDILKEDVCWIDTHANRRKPHGTVTSASSGAGKKRNNHPGPRVTVDDLVHFSARRRVAVYWLEEHGGGTWYEGNAQSANPAKNLLRVRYDQDDGVDDVDVTAEKVAWVDSDWNKSRKGARGAWTTPSPDGSVGG